MDQGPVHREEFRLNGDQVVAKVKELINEGNIRRIVLKNEEGHTLIEVPLTAGVAVTALTAWLFPVWAAIGAIAALAAHITLVVERPNKPAE